MRRLNNNYKMKTKKIGLWLMIFYLIALSLISATSVKLDNTHTSPPLELQLIAKIISRSNFLDIKELLQLAITCSYLNSYVNPYIGKLQLRLTLPTEFDVITSSNFEMGIPPPPLVIDIIGIPFKLEHLMKIIGNYYAMEDLINVEFEKAENDGFLLEMSSDFTLENVISITLQFHLASNSKYWYSLRHSQMLKNGDNWMGIPAIASNQNAAAFVNEESLLVSWKFPKDSKKRSKFLFKKDVSGVIACSWGMLAWTSDYAIYVWKTEGEDDGTDNRWKLWHDQFDHLYYEQNPVSTGDTFLVKLMSHDVIISESDVN